KQLLNFGAYSIPDTGGWLMAAAGVIMAVCAFFVIREKRVAIRNGAAAVAVLMLSSCSSGPVPIQLNKDNCHFCKMTIADARFGAEILSNKGKVWKFDDAHCVIAFMKSGELKEADFKEVYFSR